MAWVKIPIQEQWTDSNDVNASGFVVKCYLPGTTTNTPMAIDKDGVTTVTTATLNADGFAEVSGNEVALYIDRDFKIAIYENATDASNDTNAYWGPVDNIRINDIQSNFTNDYWIDNYITLRAKTSSIYTAGDLVAITDDYIAGMGIIRDGTVTDNGGTLIVFTDDSNKYWERIYTAVTPEMFGVEPNAASNQTTEMQAFLDHVRDTGDPAIGTGATYRLDTAITLQSNAVTAKNYIIDWRGSTIDFNNTALTTGALFTLGATSQANAHDKERIVMRNVTLIGPETESAHTTNNNSTTTTTLYLNNALHVTLADVVIKQSYKGLHTNFVFPARFDNVEVRTSYIPYHIDSNSTTAVWTKCGATDSYFSWLVQPTTNGDQLSNQVLVSCRVENCERGFHLDPLDGANFGVDSICLYEPYFENVTGHHVSHGKAFDFTDALSNGTDRTGGVVNCHIRGGLWSKARLDIQ